MTYRGALSAASSQLAPLRRPQSDKKQQKQKNQKPSHVETDTQQMLVCFRQQKHVRLLSVFPEPAGIWGIIDSSESTSIRVWEVWILGWELLFYLDGQLNDNITDRCGEFNHSFLIDPSICKVPGD